jgi:tripartite-type tricarboxylate transporter receptor subunit TctC
MRFVRAVSCYTAVFRSWVQAIGCAMATAFVLAPALAWAQAPYPTKAIRVVVPFPAGTSPDVQARMWGEKLSKSLSQPVVIDNRPGATTIIGTQLVTTAPAERLHAALCRAKHDGDQSVRLQESAVQGRRFRSGEPPGYGSARADRVGELSHRVASELIQAAKEKPGKLNFASYGIGQGTHLAMVRLLNAAGVTMNHVPYKDGGINDVISGAVDLSFEASMTAVPNIKGGKVRALAVSSAPSDWTRFPTSRRLEKACPVFLADSWTGVFVLKGTPPGAITKLAAESQKIVEDEDFRKRLRDLGLVPGAGNPAEFARLIAEDFRAWSKVVRENDVKVE